MTIKVGEPFRLDPKGLPLSRDVRQQMTDEIMYEIARLLPEQNRGVYADLEKNKKYFEENSVEPTEELLEAISILNDAQDKDYAQKCHIEQMVKLSEYELQKIYFEVIKELTKEEHLSDMVIPVYIEKDLIN